MRPIFWREFKELALAAAIAVLAAVVAALSMAFRVDPEGLLAFGAIAGGLLGVVQGVLDRRRRGDRFTLHRPLGAGRLHAARTFAGLAHLLLVFFTYLAAHRIGVAYAIARQARFRHRFGVVIDNMYPSHPRNLEASEILLLAGVLLAAWAVVRTCVGCVRWGWIPVLVAALGLMLLAWTARFSSMTGAGVFLLGIAALISAGGCLFLVGDRR